MAAKAPVEEKKEVKEVHGSDKVIKYFKTKIEGTEYIVKVSGNQGTKVVVRLKNGKFQKFDNAMRALSYAKTSKEDD